MVTPAARPARPPFPVFNVRMLPGTPGHAFGGAMHPYARMFPDASGRIPNPPARQSQRSATAPDPEPSPKERTAVDEAEIAAAAAVVRECDRAVLERALGRVPSTRPRSSSPPLALQTAAKSRSPLNVLKGVDPGRLVRVHERAMEALAVSVEETARDLFSPITALTPSLAGKGDRDGAVPPPGAGERRDGHELNASREREARGNAKKGWGGLAQLLRVTRSFWNFSIQFLKVVPRARARVVTRHGRRLSRRPPYPPEPRSARSASPPRQTRARAPVAAAIAANIPAFWYRGVRSSGCLTYRG